MELLSTKEWKTENTHYGHRLTFGELEVDLVNPFHGGKVGILVNDENVFEPHEHKKIHEAAKPVIAAAKRKKEEEAERLERKIRDSIRATILETE